MAFDKTIELKPDHAKAYYNKACVFVGRTMGGEALDSLARALEIDAELSEVSKIDDDFAFLRDHPEYSPRFWELVGKGEEDKEEGPGPSESQD